MSPPIARRPAKLPYSDRRKERDVGWHAKVCLDRLPVADKGAVDNRVVEPGAMVLWQGFEADPSGQRDGLAVHVLVVGLVVIDER